MTAAENRTCITTLRLSDYKLLVSLSSFLRHHELTDDNVSYFLIAQLKTETSIDLTVTRRPVRPVKQNM